MQLKAVYRIRGVKEVITGKGKGSTVAEPGDIFVPHSDESGKALLADRNAVKPNESHVHVSKLQTGPAVTLADDLSGEDGIDLGGAGVPAQLSAPAEKAAVAKAVKAQKAAKAAAAKKAAAKAPAADASLDDLGLGEDNGEEDKVE
jgi:hypothetical protein